MAKKLIRVGIVGKRGLAFAEAFRTLPQTTLAALCETDEVALHTEAERHGIPGRFTRYAEMLDSVDLVVIATPMHLHTAQAIQALRADKHVLSEVTAAVSLDECWRLRDAALQSRGVYMMAENYCYLRDNVLIREMARRGLFGDLYFGEGEYLHEVRALHHNPDGSPTWRYFWQVGVNGCTYGTHSLGPVMQWFTAVDPSERIDSVHCVGTGRHTDPEHPHDDTTLMLVTLQSGKLIKVRLDMLSNRPHLPTYYSLQGTRGVYEASRFPGQPGQVWIGENRPDDHRAWRSLADFEEHLPPEWRTPPPEALRAGHGGGDYFVIRDFVNAVEQGTPPPIDLFASLEWTAAGLCSQLSIAQGSVAITVPDFRDPAQRPLLLDAPTVIV